MPNRILKESICTSETIDELSWFEEVLFYRLIVSCDDYGRYDGRAAIIKNRLFPLKDDLTKKAVEDGLRKLTSVGLVVLYEHDGKPYLYLPSWVNHQSTRAKSSKYPEPNLIQTQSHESICNHMQADVPDIRNTDSLYGIRNTNASNDAREDAALKTIMTFYMENISLNAPSSLVTAAVRGYISDLSSEVVLHAMEIAAEADKHDWRYVKAILDRYKASGFTSLESVILDEKRARAQKNAKTNSDPYSGYDPNDIFAE